MRGPGRAATSPQDLTHRLRASGPHDFSVRGRSRLIVRGWRVLTPDDRRDRYNCAVSCRACDKLTVSRPAITPIAPTLPRPPQPGPHLVTIAKRPFDGPRCCVYATNPKFGKVKCFCEVGLTRCFARRVAGRCLDPHPSFRARRRLVSRPFIRNPIRYPVDAGIICIVGSVHQGLVCLDGLKKSKTMRSDGFRPFVLRTHPDDGGGWS